MPICKLPNGDYYFFSKFNGSTEILLKQVLDIHIPKFLEGKKARVKIELIKDEERKNNKI